MRSLINLTLLTLVVMGIASPIQAGDLTCAHCGHSGGCKTCRLVPEDRKIEIVCWGMKREEFCVPGCSKPFCKHCDEVCGPAEASVKPNGTCTKTRTFKWMEWIPASSAKIYTRNKLMKKIVTRKVPGYKWVVEDLCPQCEANCHSVAAEPGIPVPPPPATVAKVLTAENSQPTRLRSNPGQSTID